MRRNDKTIETIARIVVVLLFIIFLLVILSGCRQSEKVSYNIRKEADAFNVVRRLTVFNTRTDKILMQMTGTFAIRMDSDGDLNVVCELPDGVYENHFVHINEWTTYVVEDLSGAEVSKYSYELNFLPVMVPNVKIDITD